VIPKDYTAQEKIVAKCLDELGFRYDTQVDIGRFSADFYIKELNTVVEADGIYGHLRKGDAKRDTVLEELGIERIVHIKARSKEEIKKELMEKMCLE